MGAALFLRGNALRRNQADPGVPVPECGPGCAATESGRYILVERASLANVLGGDPDVRSIRDRSAVVAPARPRRIADEGLVAGEPVIRANPSLRHIDVSNAILGIDRSVRGAWEVTGADEGEGHDTIATRR